MSDKKNQQIPLKPHVPVVTSPLEFESGGYARDSRGVPLHIIPGSVVVRAGQRHQRTASGGWEYLGLVSTYVTPGDCDVLVAAAMSIKSTQEAMDLINEKFKVT